MGKLQKIFFALSNKNRFQIYELVLKKEKNITEISEDLNQKYPNVLKNLKILKDAEMISFDKRVTDKSQETFVKGTPLKEGSVYQDVYLEIKKEMKED
jgi:predicted transcriptional regulator